MERRVFFISGKGGVGKTVIAAGLSKFLSRHGGALCLTLDQSESLAAYLGVSGIATEPVEISSRLWAAHIDRNQTLADFVLQIVRIQSIADWIIKHPLFPYVSSSAPGIREYLILERIRQYSVSGHPPVRFIVVDTPSTGHALDFFSISKMLRNLLKTGPFRSQALKTEAFLQDRPSTQIILATIPLEIPILETIEFHYNLIDKLGIHPSSIVLNMFESAAGVRFYPITEPENIQSEDSRISDPAECIRILGETMFGELQKAIEMQQYRHSISGESLEIIRKSIRIPVFQIPFLVHRNPSDLSTRISRQFERNGNDFTGN